MEAEMESLLLQMSQGEQDDEFMQAWTRAMSHERSPSPTPSTSDKTYQQRMQETVDKLKQSAAQHDTTPDMDDDALLADMMKHMEGLGGGGDMDAMIEGMMNQLMSRDLLYEPMKELSVKYPEWLEKNRDGLSGDEVRRYERQLGHIQELVRHFDGTKETNTPDQLADVLQDPKVTEMMEKIQACGAPPVDLMKQLSPDMEMDDQGLPQMPADCCVM